MLATKSEGYSTKKPELFAQFKFILIKNIPTVVVKQWQGI